MAGTRIRTGPVEAAYDDQLRPPDGELAARLGATTLLKLGVMLARRGEQHVKWQKLARLRWPPTRSPPRPAST